MAFDTDYMCREIERDPATLAAVLRRLANESLRRPGSSGRTARLLRTIAARVERATYETTTQENDNANSTAERNR